jgi:site-specific recombinase XerD
MASLHLRSGGTYHLSFRYQGILFQRSLRTSDKTEAQQRKSGIERTLKLLDEGILSLGAAVTSHEIWRFLQSGGKPGDRTRVKKSVTLRSLAEAYLKSFPGDAKEASSLKSESIHLNHLCRILGSATLIEDVGPEQMRHYVECRSGAPGLRGRTIRPVTIRKELQTIQQYWAFGRTCGCVDGENLVSQIKKPRKSQKLPFMAWEEIQRRVDRGGLSGGEIGELWEALFLREAEIGAFLTHVRSRAEALPRFPFIYPMLVFCAYTGARRSEAFRCLVDDVKDNVMLREKKRTQDQTITFREVPQHPQLKIILDDWIANHPGGQYLFCKNGQQPIEDRTSRLALKAVTRESKWEVLRGFHVLRHSFASNLARHSIDQYKIDEMMGHQTDDMRRRYRHLFPEDRKSAVEVLTFG